MPHSGGFHDGMAVQQGVTLPGWRGSGKNALRSRPTLENAEAFQDRRHLKQHLEVLVPAVAQHTHITRVAWRGHSHHGNQAADTLDHTLWRGQVPQPRFHLWAFKVGEDQRHALLCHSDFTAECIEPSGGGMPVEQKGLEHTVFVHHAQSDVGQGRIHQTREFTPNPFRRNGAEAIRSPSQGGSECVVHGPCGMVRWRAGCESIDAQDSECVFLQALVGEPNRTQTAGA